MYTNTCTCTNTCTGTCIMLSFAIYMCMCQLLLLSMQSTRLVICLYLHNAQCTMYMYYKNSTYSCNNNYYSTLYLVSIYLLSILSPLDLSPILAGRGHSLYNSTVGIRVLACVIIIIIIIIALLLLLLLLLVGRKSFD